MQNILRLELYNGHVFDRWQLAIGRSLDRLEEKALGGGDFTDRCTEFSREVDAEEKRLNMLYGNLDINKAYALALEEIRKDEQLAKHASKVRNSKSDSGRRKIRLVMWHGLGREIPFIDLDGDKVIGFLYKNDFEFIMGKGWLFDKKRVGRNKFDALAWFDENVKKVRRIAFI